MNNIKKVLLVGAGNMGAWLVEEFCLDYEVAVFDRDLKRMKYLFKAHRFSNLEEIKDFAPDLMINAVSLQYTYEAFDMVMPYLPQNCIVSDIASVKNDLPEFYKKTKRRFVSTHPMFGPTFANLKDLSSHNAIIIKEGDEEGQKFFRNFYKNLNLKLFEYSFREHDKVIAYSLSIPFTSSLIFASCMKKIDAPGTTFKKHMSIAQGLLSENYYLLSEVMLNQYTLEQIDKIRSKLDNLSKMVQAKDTPALHKFFKELKTNID